MIKVAHPDAIKPINLSVNFSKIQAVVAVAQIAPIISITWTHLETTRAEYMKTVRNILHDKRLYAKQGAVGISHEALISRFLRMLRSPRCAGG